MTSQPAINFAPLPRYPICYSEWCAAIREVKLLHFGRQYKQCAGRCTELLEEGKHPAHPIHATVLSFYAASSLETIAQTLSSSSNTKLPLLNSARSYYLAAALFLSTGSPPGSPSPSSSEFSRTTIGDDSNSPCSLASPATTPYRFSDEGEEEEDLTDARAFAASKARIAAKRKEKVVRFSPSTSFSPDSAATSNGPPTTDTYFRKRAQLRLQAHLADMGQKLESHLKAIEKLIAKTEEEKRKQPYSGAPKEREDRRIKRREWIMRRGWRSDEREE
ncbi:MAG: hypothetical protein M1813_001078 [Trichoglossum hirsutum]|nr:MAG: hypothetical protein M1813_001078 [Trichoglossum hirsutum]